MRFCPDLPSWLLLTFLAVGVTTASKNDSDKESVDGHVEVGKDRRNSSSTTPAATTTTMATTTTTIATTEEIDLGPQLEFIPCSGVSDCESLTGAYCDLTANRCTCKPDYPVTDTHNCFKESRFDEFCNLDLQCERIDRNTKCHHDLNVCRCKPRYQVQKFDKGSWCMEYTSNTSGGAGSYYDPALFGIMGGLALMFIIMCVVLQLFAKAQFQENRSIFNTPNPRLMNVSLIKDRKFFSSQFGSDATSAADAANKKRRRSESLAAAAIAAAAFVGTSASPSATEAARGGGGGGSNTAASCGDENPLLDEEKDCGSSLTDENCGAAKIQLLAAAKDRKTSNTAEDPAYLHAAATSGTTPTTAAAGAAAMTTAVASSTSAGGRKPKLSETGRSRTSVISTSADHHPQPQQPPPPQHHLKKPAGAPPVAEEEFVLIENETKA